MLCYNITTKHNVYNIKYGETMEKKIITNTDSNLITLQYSEISEQAIIKNELLIKELLFILKNDNKYVTADDLEAIKSSEIIKTQVEQLLKVLQVDNLNDVKQLIKHLNNQIKTQTKTIEELEFSHQQELLSLQFEYEQQIANLKQENRLLEKSKETFKQKYEGQKNRKVIRMVDKVAKR